MIQISLTEYDRHIYQNEIKPFLPERIFDAHTHLLKTEFHPNLQELNSLAHEFGDADLNALRHWWQQLFPQAQIHGLMFGFPTFGCDMQQENEFVAQEVRNSPNKFSLLVHPDMPQEDLEKEILRLKPAGLKPYLVFAKNNTPGEADITDFLAESHIALAHKYGLAVTLHVSKQRGMADKDNLRDIKRLVKEYDKCQFILAHCGRCFITPNMIDTLKYLPVAENLWLDTSAVCDMGVFLYLFDKYDRTKILFGSDGISSVSFRGSYTRLGMGWHMCSQEMVQETGQLPRRQEINSATFAVYENLAAMFHAAKFCKLSETDIQNIFYNNAVKLFRL